jgi:asparagine synthase (glutamine-hydrolysing)
VLAITDSRLPRVIRPSDPVVSNHVPTDCDLQLATPCLRVSRDKGSYVLSGEPSYRGGTGGPGNASPTLFAEWSWDGETLVVRNDRYGMWPLYYACDQEGIAVSPSAAKLVAAGVPPELDEAALGVFFRLGFFLGDETPFRAIRALPPGSLLKWQNGALHCVSAGYIFHEPSDQSAEAMAREYAERFSAAVERTQPGADRVALPLSGGLDSRHLLFELLAQGRVPELCLTAASLPPGSDEDVRVASLLARQLGLRHTTVPPPPSRLKAVLCRNLLTSFCADQGEWLLALLPPLAKRSCTVYDGVGGGVLSGRAFLTRERLDLYAQGRFEEIAEGFYLAAFERLFPRGASERFRMCEVRERIAAELVRHRVAANPINSFIFWNRTRREIALQPCSILSSVSVVETPYLDPDLFDYLSSIPARTLVGSELQKRAIRLTYPEYAHFGYARWKGPPTGSHRHFRRFARELLCYLGLWNRTELVSRAHLLPRLARVLVDRTYAPNIASWGRAAAYLLHLERFASR